MLCRLVLPMFHTVIPASAYRFLMAWKPSAVRISGGAPTLTYSAPICFRNSNCSSVGVALDCAHSLIPGAFGCTAALDFRGARRATRASQRHLADISAPRQTRLERLFSATGEACKTHS